MTKIKIMKKNKILTEQDKNEILHFWGVMFGMSLTSKGIAGGIAMKAASDLEWIIREKELMDTKDLNKAKKTTMDLLLNKKSELKELRKKARPILDEFVDLYDYRNLYNDG